MAQAASQTGQTEKPKATVSTVKWLPGQPYSVRQLTKADQKAANLGDGPLLEWNPANKHTINLDDFEGGLTPEMMEYLHSDPDFKVTIKGE